jgi:hypothetical protein
MTPDPATVLNHTATKLLFELGPAMPPGYSQGSVTTLGVLLIMVAQEQGRAVDLRVEENRAMRAIFARAQKLDLEFGAELADAASREAEPLELADLNRENAGLKALLIRLHARLEELGDPLQFDVLAHLAHAAARRRIVLPAF